MDDFCEQRTLTTENILVSSIMQGDKIHGGRVFEAAHILGKHWSEIIDFSANINPLGQPRGLKKAVFGDFERTRHYPEVYAESLVEKVAALTDLAPASLMAGAGSTPHLHLVARGLEISRPVVVGPAFAEYEGALIRAGLKADYVLTRETDDWLVTAETIGRIFQRQPDAVFLAHPANPTGRLVPEGTLAELAEEAHSRRVWLILDEAFIDFTEKGKTLLPLVEKMPRLIVLRSLTKIFALPGLRLAFLAAHPEALASLSAQVEPWSLSSPAQSAGHFCLDRQAAYARRSARTVARLRRRLTAELDNQGLGRIFPSEANYVLLKLAQAYDHQSVIDHLFQGGILVRDASNFKGLGPGYLRLAVRPEAEIKTLAASLRQLPALAA